MDTRNIRLQMQKKIIENCFTNKYSDSLLSDATKVSKMKIVKTFFDGIKSINLDVLSTDDIESMIEKKSDWIFDEKTVMKKIEQTFPGWNEDRVYEEVDKLEEMYEKECEKRIDEIIKIIIRNCKSVINELEEDIRLIKEKYF